jgi:hypothetical protein
MPSERDYDPHAAPHLADRPGRPPLPVGPGRGAGGAGRRVGGYRFRLPAEPVASPAERLAVPSLVRVPLPEGWVAGVTEGQRVQTGQPIAQTTEQPGAGEHGAAEPRRGPRSPVTGTVRGVAEVSAAAVGPGPARTQRCVEIEPAGEDEW